MICGLDEAGRGPVLGPLVIAGVTFKDDSRLSEFGIRDSKQLTPSRRETLAKKIKEIAEDYEILIISASDIDDMRKVMTLNEIEVHAFSKVIKKLKPDICYVDAVDVNDQRFGRDLLLNLSIKPEIISKHKADEIYPIVGAASILAKTRRDEEVKKIGRQLEKKLNMALGSGYPADPITQQFLRTWVKQFGKLPPHTRHSWKTAAKILKENSIKNLDEF